MKATGIVRRIDDLGRVVIPKEIRRTMRIREGDPLEIYTTVYRWRMWRTTAPGSSARWMPAAPPWNMPKAARNFSRGTGLSVPVRCCGNAARGAVNLI